MILGKTYSKWNMLFNYVKVELPHLIWKKTHTHTKNKSLIASTWGRTIPVRSASVPWSCCSMQSCCLLNVQWITEVQKQQSCALSDPASDGGPSLSLCFLLSMCSCRRMVSVTVFPTLGKSHHTKCGWGELQLGWLGWLYNSLWHWCSKRQLTVIAPNNGSLCLPVSGLSVKWIALWDCVISGWEVINTDVI